MLVTGAGGFIGSAVARRLIELGHSVVTIDNLTTGVAANIPVGCTSIIGNTHDPEVIEQLSVYSFDSILHIAGQSGGIPSFADPLYDLHSNVASTLMLLEYAKESGCPTFVYASSMAVYGNPEVLPVSEDAMPAPKTFYAVGKLASEGYLQLYGEQGIACTALRLNNTYGPGQDLWNMNQGMVSIFLGQAVQSQRISVKGATTRVRDFVYIDDVVEAFVRAGIADKHPGFEVLNVGTGKGTTVEDLLDLIVSNLPFDVDIEVGGSTPGDQHGIYCANERIAASLGWSPCVELAAGIARMTAWALSMDGDEALSLEGLPA